jgi:translation initiation factor IF-2
MPYRLVRLNRSGRRRGTVGLRWAVAAVLVGVTLLTLVISPRDGHRRPTARTPVAAMSSTHGAVSPTQPGHGTPVASPSLAGGAPVVPPLAPTGAALHYTAVAGYGCSTSAGQSYQEFGAPFTGSNPWRHATQGGYVGAGCDGSYDTIPISGSTRYSLTQYPLWRFTASPVVHGTCVVDIYVPATTDVTLAGGNPAYYSAFDSFAMTSSADVGNFQLNQEQNHGTWVREGPFAVGAGQLMVRMVNRGVDPAHPDARIAAAPMRAECTA